MKLSLICVTLKFALSQNFLQFSSWHQNLTMDVIAIEPEVKVLFV